jgi:hypothetical protein
MKKPSPTKVSEPDEEGLVDSDDDERPQERKKEKDRERGATKLMKKKRPSTVSDDKRDRMERKRSRRSGERGGAAGADNGNRKDDVEEERPGSGDEYDSGEDVERNAEDDAFLAEDDDLDEVTREYDAEEQVRIWPGLNNFSQTISLLLLYYLFMRWGSHVD